MAWPQALTTERLVLRPWRTSDAYALFSYASDPHMGPSAGWPPHHSAEESLQVLQDVLMVPETYAITIRDREPADEAVGSISLRLGEKSSLAIGVDEGELGYWIGQPFQSQGYMTEAVRALMLHGFDDLGLRTIWAAYRKPNLASWRVQQKVGMHKDRTIRGMQRPAMGDRVDSVVTKITRAEWEMAQSADPVDAATIQAQQAEADGIAASLRRIAYIRSGGQTGADRAALDAAREAGVPICGWCPPGGLAEDLPEAPGLLEPYPELVEGASEGYVERTAWNVRDSHATLIVAPAGLEPCSGTQMTKRFADDMGRPCLVIGGTDELGEVRAWLEDLGRELTLNVAGPRESKTPGTYAITREVIRLLLAQDGRPERA